MSGASSERARPSGSPWHRAEVCARSGAVWKLFGQRFWHQTRGEKTWSFSFFWLKVNKMWYVYSILNVMLDVHLVFFLFLSESKRNIHNDMYTYIHIYICSKFIECLFPTPVLQPLNKKSTYIPCQDLKKKINHLLVGGVSNPYLRCFETAQLLQPPRVHSNHLPCGPSSRDTAATPVVPPVAAPVGDTGAAPVLSGGTSQARSSLLGAPGGFYVMQQQVGVIWEEGFCCSLVKIDLLIRPSGAILGVGGNFF